MKLLVIGLLTLGSLALVLQPAIVMAAKEEPAPAYSNNNGLNGKCDQATVDASNCSVVAYIVLLIKVLSGLVGIVVVTMITIGGIQYSAAKDNPQAITAAKGKIINAILGLVLYIFGFALLNYLIPGGVL